jgi:hypothetical protein
VVECRFHPAILTTFWRRANEVGVNVKATSVKRTLKVTVLFKPSDKGGYPNDQFTDFLQLGKNVDLSVFRGLHHGLGEMCFMIPESVTP